jgi:hypothetical protein
VKAYKLLPKPLGRYHMYYGPHNGSGFCLAYADKLEGSWKEYAQNPIVDREWPPHFEVTQVASSDSIWNSESKPFLYFHGENNVTRYVTSNDGTQFTYGGLAATTEMFDHTGAEASYSRIFRYTIPGKVPDYRPDGAVAASELLGEQETAEHSAPDRLP